VTTRWTLSGDAADPQRLAAFWKRALGYIDEEGYDFPDGAALVDPDGKLPPISFLKVPEGKTAKNRLHIDVRISYGQQGDAADELIRAKMADVVEAGAHVVTEHTYDGHVVGIVLQDPEGNEFCIA
jgi:glyoxalase superfamily protein